MYYISLGQKDDGYFKDCKVQVKAGKFQSLGLDGIHGFWHFFYSHIQQIIYGEGYEESSSLESDDALEPESDDDYNDLEQNKFITIAYPIITSSRY